VAALAGLAIGVERERSGHATGPGARFAGARTFLLLGLASGFAGWYADRGFVPIAVAIVAGGAGLAIAAYIMAARRTRESIDGTTEAAALTVLALGVASGMGHIVLASAATAVVALVLAEKGRIQRAIQRIEDEELRAAFQFGVLALVILPLLPVGPYGPLGGFRPRELWVWVLLFSGISFAGYLARRAVGDTRGYRVTGLLGGLVSSTAVALAFSRQSRTEPRLAHPLAVGVVAASVVPFFRVSVISFVINPAVTARLLPYLVVPFLVSGAVLAYALGGRRTAREEDPAVPVEKNPLRLDSAIKMTVGFQLVLFAIAFVQQRFGEAGIITTAGLVGLTDVDALTLSMAKLGQQAGFLEIAARAVAVGLIANTALKLVLAVALGERTFRRSAGLGLALLTVASAAGLQFPLHLERWLAAP
jgi:uncharacterized membrane protein (DUF4010 family)